MSYINITQYLDATAETRYSRIAVREGEEQITLAELRRRCLFIAKSISTLLQNRRNQIIAVFLPKSIDSIAVNIGIIYSGNAYMNLDVKHPKKRIAAISNLIQPTIIITRTSFVQQLPETPIPILTLEEMDEGSKKFPPLSVGDEASLLERRNGMIDTDPLCIINTSGSTGIPKAVVLNHRSFIDFTERVIERGLITDKEVVASLSPLIFDIYSFELCMLMAKGSTLLLVPESFSAFPVRILELMADRKATFIFWVPTIMVNIANLDLLSHLALPDLKMIWFAGEVFPTAKFNYWRKKLPQAAFANFYGPIEITLDCVYYLVERELRDDEPIPIGIPFRNTDILILDENDKPAPQGEEGELCVRGTSLAMGYYNNQEKTAAAFVQNPLNKSYPETIYRTGDIVYVNDYSEIVFKGRKDTLIKHQGYRIELAEIEHAVISAVAETRNCCALYTDKKIVLFYEARAPLDEKSFRLRLGEILPRYMLPMEYIHITEMPRNVNGKIDRLRLSRTLVQ
jgi:amino acid adenylation domain-containing protein